MDEMAILERELLSKEPRRAKPVGLRYDRFAREGLLCGACDYHAKAAEHARTAKLHSPGKTAGPTERARPTEMDKCDETAGWYFRCNAVLISRLLTGCRRVLVSCEEGGARETPDVWDGEVTRVCLSSFPGESAPETPLSPTGDTIQIETYAKLPLDNGSFDGIIADSSILLSGDVAASLAEFRRTLKPGGTLCALVANWEYEMAGNGLLYETSFKRYGGDVYLGFLRRTLSPPEEVEYVCRLDPRESVSQELALMSRDELRALTLADVPRARQHVLSVELIEIPQMTAASLRNVCEEAGFRNVVVAGAPGVLASRLAVGRSPHGRDLSLEEACRNLAYSFPFVGSSDSPHLVAVGKA